VRSINVIVLVCAVSAIGACGASAPSAPTPVTVPLFKLTSAAAVDGGTLPAEYTCDGEGVSAPLAWQNAPAGTREFALLMTTLPGDGTTKWNWVLYAIPATVTALPRNSTAIGTFGVGSDGPQAAYQPPCSQGPGAKIYTFTVYALSSAPQLPAGRIDGATLARAIAPLTIGSATMSVSYTRPR
jgi:phosphatidylethanolamine-binding protein (PEBP) family uncharacterized protein